MSVRPVRRVVLPALVLGIVCQFCCTRVSAATALPQEHDYQKALRTYLGTLTAKDFEHGVTQMPTVTPISDPDELYRTWLLTLEFPRVGRKRSYPAVNLPATEFTLSTIEDPQQGIIRPALWPEPAAWLANWKYAGNPYNNSRAMKLRAFTTATVLMLMIDDLQAHPTGPKDTRADWFGPHLILFGYTYNAVRDVIPPEARAAYEACLKKMMRRVSDWGPRGDETHFDISTVLGMRLAADAIKDPETTRLAEAYAKRVFSDEWYYHPAGYFPDQGCLDAGFQGLSLYFATWLALASPDWPFVQDAVKKSWRLRGYLLLPEPDGALVGPAHFNSRTSSDVLKDQWDWPFRYVAGSFLTDDAACQARFPTDEQLKSGPVTAVGEFGAQLNENPGYIPSEKLKSSPWAWRLWPDSPQFPMNNYAYDYYPKGYFARRQELAKNNSPLLKYPFQRDGNFTEKFGDAFYMAKRSNFGVIIHTGPVSEFQGEGHAEYNGPYGLSGGSLSAFWTPATGCVLLGRRGGMTLPGGVPVSLDKPEAWRTWPVHAVSGATTAGKFFTSARIQKPNVSYADIAGEGKGPAILVDGVIPAAPIGKEKVLNGKLDYTRTFTPGDTGLGVETTIKGDGADQVAELYEVLPVFLKEAALQAKATPTGIQFQVDGGWTTATDKYSERVQAVRLERFDGAVEIRFDRPRRVKLSPADWADAYLSRAVCRNVLVDLLENKDQPAAIKEAKSISYQIQSAKK